MSLTPEQTKLYEALAAPLAHAADPEAVSAHLSAVLNSLLRRKGDADFLQAVQSAFASGVSGNPPLERQRVLAREVIAVVIAKRPEIAAAFAVKSTDQPAPAQRRAPDLGIAVPATPPDPPIAAGIVPPDPVIAPSGSFEFAAAEAMARSYVIQELRRKLAVFRPEPPPATPTMGYCDPPFFLWRDEFREVVVGFVADHVLPLIRQQLVKTVYRPCPVAELQGDPDKQQRYFADKRKAIFDRLALRLGKLQGQYATAAAKLVRRAEMNGAEEGEIQQRTKIVTIPVQVPRFYNVLGVTFRLGTQTKMQRLRVPIHSALDLEEEEERADTLMRELRQASAARSLELPAAVDFQLLRMVVDMDDARFLRLYREMLALLRDAQTSRNYVLQRVRGIDEHYNSLLSDIMLAMLFHSEGDGMFGFDVIYALCIGASTDKSAMARRRPLLQELVLQRPEALARQICKLIDERASEERLRAAAGLYLKMKSALPRSRFSTELESGIRVFRAYAMMIDARGEGAVIARILAVLAERLSRSGTEMTWWGEVANLVRGLAAGSGKARGK